MNKDMLEKRIADLRKVLGQIQANGNATIGAIQECNYWLDQINNIDQKVDDSSIKEKQ